MVKTNELFKVQYVAPKVKEFEVRPQLNVLSNFGEAGRAGAQGGYEEEEDDF